MKGCHQTVVSLSRVVISSNVIVHSYYQAVMSLERVVLGQ